MNRTVIAISLSIIALIVAGGVYLSTSNDTDEPVTPPASTQTVDEASDETEGTSEPVTASGEYVEYEEGIIGSTEGTKLLFFHAPWCPQCLALEADIEANGVPEGVTIIKVDYDSNQELRQRYGVTLQTTVVRVDDDGNEVESFVAYDSPTVNAVEQNLL